MSTFEGRLKENKLKFMCLDNFETHNLDAEAFFLSHFHSDHMSGLKSPEFRDYLVQEDEVYLYCSKVTKVLIVGRHNFPENKVIGLEVGKPFIIESRSTKIVVQVELIATGHCPGAVMFLIEHDEESVLYTGDFRINPDDLARIKIFEKFARLEKKLSSLYLDTQFASPYYQIFPTRQESVDIIVKHINHWLQMDAMNTVGIQRTAHYGLEGIIAAVAKQIGMQILVEINLYENLYKHIEEFLPYITTDQKTTKVHICYMKQCHFCRSNRKCKVIRPCAMTFTTPTLLRCKWKEPTDDISVKVPYATHSSLSELISFVQYVKPKTVHANVICEDTTEDEILSYLNMDPNNPDEDCVEEFKSDRVESVYNNNNDDKCTRSTEEGGVNEKTVTIQTVNENGNILKEGEETINENGNALKEGGDISKNIEDIVNENASKAEETTKQEPCDDLQSPDRQKLKIEMESQECENFYSLDRKRPNLDTGAKESDDCSPERKKSKITVEPEESDDNLGLISPTRQWKELDFS